jgi:mono/diheme cytochrome c family protein
MLRAIDWTLELIAWVAALVLVSMLFIGPQLVAEDKPADQGGEAAGAAPYAAQASSSGADGEALFTDRCGSCHTLSAAGTSGSTGPNLDETELDAAAIEGIVRDGSGTMPAFGGELSDEEVRAVAAFVADN